MEQSTKKNGLINFLALVVAAATAFFISRMTNSLAGHLSATFMGLGALVAAVSWFQMRLEDNERLEKFELDELARTRGGSTLFEGRDAEVFPAQRSREQFERYFVPIFTLVLLIAQAVSAFFLWRWLEKPTTVADVKAPTI